MLKITVASNDFKLAYIIRQLLNNKYDFEHILPDDNLSNSDLVITTQQEAIKIKNINLLILSSDMNQFEMLSRIISNLKKNEYSKCVVGLDPGKNIGVSIIFKGELISSNLFTNLDNLIRWIKRNLSIISYRSLEIKIGNGDKNSSKKVYNRIIKDFNSDIVKFVNEKQTSIRKNYNITEHEEAAIRIAYRL